MARAEGLEPPCRILVLETNAVAAEPRPCIKRSGTFRRRRRRLFECLLSLPLVSPEGAAALPFKDFSYPKLVQRKGIEPLYRAWQARILTVE